MKLPGFNWFWVYWVILSLDLSYSASPALLRQVKCLFHPLSAQRREGRRAKRCRGE